MGCVPVRTLDTWLTEHKNNIKKQKQSPTQNRVWLSTSEGSSWMRAESGKKRKK